LAALASYEQDLDEGERNLRAPQDTFVPAGGLIAMGEAMTPAMNEIGLQQIAEDRRQLVSDRERIYQANPSLRPRQTARPTRSTPLATTASTSSAFFTVGNNRIPQYLGAFVPHPDGVPNSLFRIANTCTQDVFCTYGGRQFRGGDGTGRYIGGQNHGGFFSFPEEPDGYQCRFN
jgi:hypothetical protein